MIHVLVRAHMPACGSRSTSRVPFVETGCRRPVSHQRQTQQISITCCYFGLNCRCRAAHPKNIKRLDWLKRRCRARSHLDGPHMTLIASKRTQKRSYQINHVFVSVDRGSKCCVHTHRLRTNKVVRHAPELPWPPVLARALPRHHCGHRNTCKCLSNG